MTSSPTLADWLDYWIDRYAVLRCESLKTVERYRSLARYLQKTSELRDIAEAPLPELSHRIIEPAILSLFKVKPRRGDKLSFRTVRHFAALLHVALEKAFILEHIPANPMGKVELPPLKYRKVEVFTEEDLKAVRAASWPEWWAVLIDLALASGCRRGELLGLEWADVSFNTQTLRVSKSVEQTGDGLRLKSTKGGRPRSLTLPVCVLGTLEKYRGDRKGAALIFTNPTTESYFKPDWVSQKFCRRMRDLGLANRNLHGLRHTHATYLLSRGVPLKTVSERLGHADPNITLRLYVHALPADDKRAAEEWTRFLDELDGKQ